MKPIPKNIKGKTILLRSDLNSDVIDGRVLMSERIKQATETIKFLKKQKAKIVIIAHQGKPNHDDFTSLKPHSKLLSKYTKVKFIDDITGKKAGKIIRNLKIGEAILLNNIRKLDGEFKPEKKNNKLLKLTKITDLYVNDAFSVCHRNHASITLLPKFMKSYAGPLLLKELNALKKIKIKNCLYILGGSKPEDNLRLLKGKKVLACGLFGQACLLAKGKNLGAQDRYLKNNIKDFDKITKQLKSKLRNVKTPEDFAVKVNDKRKELSLEEFPNKYEIFDIGKKTQDIFVREIRKAEAIYMKGPAGFAGDRRFTKGTNIILKAISKNKGFSLLGGGHLSDAVANSRIPKSKFGYISLSGGALLRYIAGEKLPGLEAIK